VQREEKYILNITKGLTHIDTLIKAEQNQPSIVPRHPVPFPEPFSVFAGGTNISQENFSQLLNFFMETMRPIAEKRLQQVGGDVLMVDETFKLVLKIRGNPVQSCYIVRNTNGQVSKCLCYMSMSTLLCSIAAFYRYLATTSYLIAQMRPRKSYIAFYTVGSKPTSLASLVHFFSTVTRKMLTQFYEFGILKLQ
jgi:hypothetical protein